MTNDKPTKELGFTPINSSDVFESSPKLKEALEKLGDFEFHFKKPEPVLLTPDNNQNLIQGTMSNNISGELVDFELTYDYLLRNSNLVTMPRKNNSNSWGNYEIEPEICKFSNPDELTNGFLNANCNAVITQATSPTDPLIKADKKFTADLEHLNKEIGQSPISQPDAEFIESINPRKPQ